MTAANSIRQRDHTNAASGPDYYGFSNGTIAMIIQELPNAEKCLRYVRRLYVEVPLEITGGVETAGRKTARSTTARENTAAEHVAGGEMPKPKRQYHR